MEQTVKKRKVVIFGDSYSTFAGYIPKGNAIYYAPDSEDPTDVRRVEDTWWHRCGCKLNWDLVLNDSWSGSTVCYTGKDGIDCSTTSSFIYRFRKLVKSDFFKTNGVDTVLVFGGTNDSWKDSPIGEMKFSDWTEADLYYVLPAFCHLAYSLKQELPNATIAFLVNTGLKPEISEAIIKAAEYYGVDALVLRDIDKAGGHPTIEGMRSICDQTVEYLVSGKTV